MKKHRHLKSTTLLTLILLLSPSLLLAADKTVAIDNAHTAWILTATTLVLFMTIPGLALFYGGLVRSKNVLSVLVQCFAITGLASILWLALGYSLAFDETGPLNGLVGGLGKAFNSGINADSLYKDTGLPETLFQMFQMTFAIITPALIVGAFAERMKFSALLLFSAAWLLLVYAPVCHWIWGGGWLTGKVWDFAGGTVVHVNAGIASLVAALVIGKRRGFPDTHMPPHNLTMAITGAAMLWVGWFGFNAGSALKADSSAAMAMLVTHLGAASGTLAWMFMEWKKFGKPSALGLVTGMVAGLGTITPASGFVGPIGALLIGLAAGVICFYATQFIKRKLEIDDSLDVFPVHGVGGILGTLLAAVFGLTLDGQKVGQNIDMLTQFGYQALGVAVTLLWSGILTFVILKVVDMLTGVRVSAEQETEGLDITQHEESGYNL